MLMVLHTKSSLYNQPKEIGLLPKKIKFYLAGLLHVIWETLNSQALVVLAVVPKVNANVTVSVDTVPMST